MNPDNLKKKPERESMSGHSVTHRAVVGGGRFCEYAGAAYTAVTREIVYEDALDPILLNAEVRSATPQRARKTSVHMTPRSPGQAGHHFRRITTPVEWPDNDLG
jgi:hypothetical protein